MSQKDLLWNISRKAVPTDSRQSLIIESRGSMRPRVRILYGCGVRVLLSMGSEEDVSLHTIG